ncbi:MAG: NAD-dependent epimerase/dehydratase family protein [Lachnospiraceae bacterium]
MSKLYIVTGAGGHLGSAMVRLLCQKKQMVRGLILPGEHKTDSQYVTYFKGDVREKKSLEPLFMHSPEQKLIVIHTAGIVDISDRISHELYEVNVLGTKHIVELCMKHQVKRLVYVSSVHALPEKKKPEVMVESSYFSPAEVVGGYAKTKAMASKMVLHGVKNGLDAVIVHPSGILGPYDESRNHLVQLVEDYQKGRLPACVKGGYDFVDVRDVAKGCFAAALKGKTGECYILSNRHYEVREVLQMIRDAQGGRIIPTLPSWMAIVAVPFVKLVAKRRNQRPLYTAYSLYTLKSNDRFSHDKATKELGYQPRNLRETIQDTLDWLNQ